MHRIRRLGRGGKLLLALAVGGAVFGAVSAVQAAIPDANGVIHGCYQYTTTNGNYGKLRVFDTAKGGGCNSLEKPLNWNQKGPTGPRGTTGPTGPGASEFVRLAADWHRDEISTTTSHTLYNKTVTVPAGMQTLYVEVTGQADDHDSAVQTLTCTVDGNNCQPGPEREILNVGDNDWHDNSVIARWCFSVSPGDRTVNIDQSSDNDGQVYIENILTTIDADSNPGLCTEDTGFASIAGGAPTHPATPAHH